MDGLIDGLMEKGKDWLFDDEDVDSNDVESSIT